MPFQGVTKQSTNNSLFFGMMWLSFGNPQKLSTERYSGSRQNETTGHTQEKKKPGMIRMTSYVEQ